MARAGKKSLFSFSSTSAQPQIYFFVLFVPPGGAPAPILARAHTARIQKIVKPTQQSIHKHKSIPGGAPHLLKRHKERCDLLVVRRLRGSYGYIFYIFYFFGIFFSALTSFLVTNNASCHVLTFVVSTTPHESVCHFTS